MAEINLKNYVRKVESLVKQGSLEEALAHARHILGRYPKHADTYRLMGTILLKQSRWEEAAEISRRLLGAYPNDFVAHYNLSIAYENLKQANEALWHAERAYDQQPNNEQIIKRLRDLYQKLRGQTVSKIQLTAGAVAQQNIASGLYDQAINSLRDSLNRLPDRVDLREKLAVALWQTGRHVDAAEVALEVVQAIPYSIAANRILAQLWLDEQRPSDARRYLSRLEDVDPYLALTLASGEAISDETFKLDELNYGAYAQQELASQKPDWLSDIEEDDTTDADFDAILADDLFGDLDMVDEVPDDAMPAHTGLTGLLGEIDDDESIDTVEETPAAPRQRTGLTGMLSSLDEEDDDDDSWLTELGAQTAHFGKEDDESQEPETVADIPDLFGDDDEFEPDSAGLTGMLASIERGDEDDFTPDSAGLTGALAAMQGEDDDEFEPDSAGLTGALRAMHGEDEDDEWMKILDDNPPELPGDDDDEFEPDSAGLTGLFKPGEQENDPMAWLQVEDEAVTEAADEHFDDFDDDDDALAWMKDSGIERAEASDEPTYDELLRAEADDDTGMMDAETDPMAWMTGSGIEFTEADDADDFDEPDDPTAWMSGDEAAEPDFDLFGEDDEDPFDTVEVEMAVDETATDTNAVSSSPIDDNDALQELMDLESLTGDDPQDFVDQDDTEWQEPMSDQWQPDNDDEMGWLDDADDDDLPVADDPMAWLTGDDSSDTDDEDEADWLSEDAADAFGLTFDADDDTDDTAEPADDVDWLGELDDNAAETGMTGLLATLNTAGDDVEADIDDSEFEPLEMDEPDWLTAVDSPEMAGDDATDDDPFADADWGDDSDEFEDEFEDEAVADSPDWLSEMDFGDETSDETDEEPAEMAEADWLSDIGGDAEDDFDEEPVGEDWLNELGDLDAEDDFDEEPIAEPAGEDWLSELGDLDAEDDFDEEPVAEPAGEDWLNELGDLDAEDDFDEEPVAEPAGEDWLNELGDLDAEDDFDEEPVAEPAGDDWLSELGDLDAEDDFDEEPVAEPAGEDWLIGVDNDDLIEDDREFLEVTGGEFTDEALPDEIEVEEEEELDFMSEDDFLEFTGEEPAIDAEPVAEQDDLDFMSEDDFLEFTGEEPATDAEPVAEGDDLDFMSEDDFLEFTGEEPAIDAEPVAEQDDLDFMSEDDFLEFTGEEPMIDAEPVAEQDDLDFMSEDDFLEFTGEEPAIEEEAAIEAGIPDWMSAEEFEEYESGEMDVEAPPLPHDDLETVEEFNEAEWMVDEGYDVPEEEEPDWMSEFVDDADLVGVTTASDWLDEDQLADEAEISEEYAFDEAGDTVGADDDSWWEDEDEEEALATDEGSFEDVEWIEDDEAGDDFGEELAAELTSADEDVEPATADNAPDWLNAMVPGLDLDYEAPEDEPVDQGFSEGETLRRREVAAQTANDIEWLTDIVDQEENAMPAPLMEPPVAAPPPAEERQSAAQFVFSKTPVWLQRALGINEAQPEPAAPPVEEPDFGADDDVMGDEDDFDLDAEIDAEIDAIEAELDELDAFDFDSFDDETSDMSYTDDSDFDDDFGELDDFDAYDYDNIEDDDFDDLDDFDEFNKQS